MTCDVMTWPDLSALSDPRAINLEGKTRIISPSISSSVLILFLTAMMTSIFHLNFLSFSFLYFCSPEPLKQQMKGGEARTVMSGLFPKRVRLPPNWDKSGTFKDHGARMFWNWSLKVHDLSNLEGNLTRFESKFAIPGERREAPACRSMAYYPSWAKNVVSPWF